MLKDIAIKISLIVGFILLIIFSIFLFALNVNAEQIYENIENTIPGVNSVYYYFSEDTNEALNGNGILYKYTDTQYNNIINDILNRHTHNNNYDNYIIIQTDNKGAYSTGYLFLYISFNGDISLQSWENSIGYRYSGFVFEGTALQSQYYYKTDATFSQTSNYPATFNDNSIMFSLPSNINGRLKYYIIDSNLDIDTTEIELIPISNFTNLKINKCSLDTRTCSPYTIDTNEYLNFSMFSSDFYTPPIPEYLELDMNDKVGVVFYFKDHNLPKISQEFILNGWYSVSYYKKVYSELSSIFELIPNGDLEVDKGDAIDNSLIINYSLSNFSWYDEVYYFWNKNSTNFTNHTILYNPIYFDYSYVYEDGTLSKPITFIDINDDEQIISHIRLDYLPYNSNVDFFGVTDIITLPLNFISSLSSSTCEPLVLPILDKDLTIPCMSQFYKDTLGNTLWTMYQTIFNGLVSYYVIVHFLIYVKEFKSPDTDKIEVIDI